VAAASCAESSTRAAREAESVVWIEQPPSAPPRAPPLAPERRATPPAPRDGPEPHHFWLLTMGEVAERREWVRVDRRTWEERYPSGAVMRYRIVGRLRDGGRVGVIARRLPDGDVDVLVPDLGTETWPAMRVAPDGDWRDLAPMHLIE
jgi:hypothetical protein